MKSNVDKYWGQFLDSLPADVEQPPHYYESFYFGTTEQGANEIPALVINGIKTATGSLKWVYDVENKPLPTEGDFSIVTNWNREPVCIIETTQIKIIPFDSVDEQFAFDGGEGDRTLAYWRQIYWEYIVDECARINRKPTLKTPIVCERFRVVYKEKFNC